MKFVYVQYQIIKKDWKVLQVGAGQQPLKRANYVLDQGSYENRKIENSLVETVPEFFTKNTWIQQDISQTPWPFEDDEFDYVIVDDCLVRSRDPIAICREMERVAKRGFVEIPNQTAEHVYGIEQEGIVGYPEHRWICDLKDDQLIFRFKHPMIQTRKEFQIFPPTNDKKPSINPKFGTHAFFWENSLSVREELEAANFPDWNFEDDVWIHKNLIGTVTTEDEIWNTNPYITVLVGNFAFLPDKIINLHQTTPKLMIKMFEDDGITKNSAATNFEKLIALKFEEDKLLANKST